MCLRSVRAEHFDARGIDRTRRDALAARRRSCGRLRLGLRERARCCAGRRTGDPPRSDRPPADLCVLHGDGLGRNELLRHQRSGPPLWHSGTRVGRCSTREVSSSPRRADPPRSEPGEDISSWSRRTRARPSASPRTGRWPIRPDLARCRIGVLVAFGHLRRDGFPRVGVQRARDEAVPRSLRTRVAAYDRFHEANLVVQQGLVSEPPPAMASRRANARSPVFADAIARHAAACSR